MRQPLVARAIAQARPIKHARLRATRTVSRRLRASGEGSSTVLSRMPHVAGFSAPGRREPDGRPHGLQRRLRPAHGDRPGAARSPRSRRAGRRVGRARRAELPGRGRGRGRRQRPSPPRSSRRGALRRRRGAGAHRAGRARAAADLDDHARRCRSGPGSSSSSALSVALALALADLAGSTVDRGRRRAPGARGRDRSATGVPGGLMDQLASLFGRAGHALLIDCRDTAVDPGADPAGDRGRRRALRRAPHARRVASTRRAVPSAKRSRPRSASRALRDATPEQVRRLAARASCRHRERARARRPPRRCRPATSRCSARCCSRATPASATTTRCRRRSSTCSSSSSSRAARPARGSPAPASAGASSRSRSANHADDVLAKATLRYRAATGIEPTGFVAQAVDGARSTDGADAGYIRPRSSAFFCSYSAVGDVALVAQAARAARSARAPPRAGAGRRRRRGAGCTIATGMLRVSIWR